MIRIWPDGVADVVRTVARMADEDAELACAGRAVDAVCRVNLARILASLAARDAASSALDYSSGYGYGSTCRDLVESVWADAMQAEAAFVRPQVMTGTHALALCLRALLRPGMILLSVTGPPYGTLCTALKGREGVEGILASRGAAYREVPLRIDGTVDGEALLALGGADVGIALIQRSRGYTMRPALTIAQLDIVIAAVRAASPRATVLVDNCYGEFVEDREPAAVGADLVAGSLLKNPGGGLAPTGGYVVGQDDLISMVANEFSAPGQGRDVGPYLDAHRWLLQGLVQAPHVVGEAIKGAQWGTWVSQRLGLTAEPTWDGRRGDIVQCLELGSAKAVLAFCRGVQQAGPLDGQAVPEGAPLPGYDCDVVMAGGTFVQGSSIEFSADGPMQPPYVVYVQGGLSAAHARIGYEFGLSSLAEAGLLPRGP